MLSLAVLLVGELPRDILDKRQQALFTGANYIAFANITQILQVTVKIFP